jgi:hypothetical protein
MMPAITRHFQEIAFIIGWFAFLILASGIVAMLAARKWGRTKRTRQMIYSVVGFVGLLTAALVAFARLRGLKFTP